MAAEWCGNRLETLRLIFIALGNSVGHLESKTYLMEHPCSFIFVSHLNSLSALPSGALNDAITEMGSEKHSNVTHTGIISVIEPSHSLVFAGVALFKGWSDCRHLHGGDVKKGMSNIGHPTLPLRTGDGKTGERIK